MTLLHPWALLLLFSLLWFFKTLFLPRSHHEKTLLVTTQQREERRQTLYLFGVVLLSILALSRPVIVNQISQEKFIANEYIIALDASFSMQADDVAPNRYSAAKASAIMLLKQNVHDRFTLFAFTTSALLICPPTTDTAIAINALNALTPKYILTKGTSLSALLKRIGTLPQAHKNLIIFTDGGDEHDLDTLLQIAQTKAITVNVVAVGSEKGSTLNKDQSLIRDENGHLVISRINPILKPLANNTNGSYLELHSDPASTAADLANMVTDTKMDAEEQTTEVISYKELYYYPLFIALMLLVFALTNLKKHLPFLALLLMVFPYSSARASLFDFYYISAANHAYADGNYTKAAHYFGKSTPSQAAFLNIAHSYYKAERYKKAMQFYSRIRSADPAMKQTVFYNMGNCAVKLKRYERAKNYYQKVLALGFDQSAYDNLTQLYRLGLTSRVDVADMMPHPNAKTQKNSSKINETQKDEEGQNGGKSNQKSTLASQGGSDSMKQTKQQQQEIIKSPSKQQYKMGYKAYEMINEGYTNEKHPW